MNNFIGKYTDLRGRKHVKRLQSEGKIAARIKKERKKQRFSQQTLADLVGVPKSTISGIETGVIIPKEDMLRHISKALNTPFMMDDAEEDKDN